MIIIVHEENDVILGSFAPKISLFRNRRLLIQRHIDKCDRGCFETYLNHTITRILFRIITILYDYPFNLVLRIIGQHNVVTSQIKELAAIV